MKLIQGSALIIFFNVNIKSQPCKINFREIGRELG